MISFHHQFVALLSSSVTMVNVSMIVMSVMVLMTVLMVAMRTTVVSTPSPHSLHLYVHDLFPPCSSV